MKGIRQWDSGKERILWSDTQMAAEGEVIVEQLRDTGWEVGLTE
jgi:hypothetical protein